MYSIYFTKEACRQIKKLDKKTKEIIRKAIERIKHNPELGKRLTGVLRGRSSYRTSKYRIIYRIYKNKLTIIVLTVGHRKEVYRR